jgi:hypothetical protein
MIIQYHAIIMTRAALSVNPISQGMAKGIILILKKLVQFLPNQTLLKIEYFH